MTIAVLTGASRGIGATAARRLAEHGVTVLAGVRDPVAASERLRSERTAGPPLDIHPFALDVTDDTSVDAAAEYVHDTTGRIDILINNAGVAGPFTEAADIGPDDFRDVLETNLLGSVRVTRAFLPLLRRGEHPRLVFVSSGMGSLGLQSTDEVYRDIHHLPYPASKAALNMLSVQYAKSLHDVLVTAVDPGLTATEFTGGRGHSVEQGSDALVAAALDTSGPTGRFLARDGANPW